MIWNTNTNRTLHTHSTRNNTRVWHIYFFFISLISSNVEQTDTQPCRTNGCVRLFSVLPLRTTFVQLIIVLKKSPSARERRLTRAHPLVILKFIILLFLSSSTFFLLFWKFSLHIGRLKCWSTNRSTDRAAFTILNKDTRIDECIPTNKKFYMKKTWNLQQTFKARRAIENVR